MQVILEQDAFVALHLSQHVRYEAAVSFHESHTRQIERVVLKVIQVERLNILKRDAGDSLTALACSGLRTHLHPQWECWHHFKARIASLCSL